MDWAALGLTDHVLRWLEAASHERYASEARLDPYATSMRDFDDVADDLRTIAAGQMPTRTRARQRVTDLRGSAGLVDASALALSALGAATLGKWDHYKIAGAGWGDELARLLVIVLEASKLNDPRYHEFQARWANLRSHFDPLQLINDWDRLYAINYLDYSRQGFTPGDVLRQEGTRVANIHFDLGTFATTHGGNPAAVAGGKKLANAIADKVPRGRHRASFAMALEVVETGGTAAMEILDRYGVPRRPRQWTPFTAAERIRIVQILTDYGMAPPRRGLAQAAAPVSSAATTATTPTLPATIDFSQVLKPPPVPQRAADTRKAGKASSSRKIDHKKKAKTDDEIGKLGEEFALRYERWRLRNQPALLANVRHVSLVDDSLGYDIESREIDGSPRYVEVKGTLGPLETRFFLSANELATAEAKGNSYVILRVARLTSTPQCCEIRHPFSEIEMVPAVYSVTFKPQP